jgi:signal peptide peptidase SppA
MKHARLIAEFLSTPWALMPEYLHAFSGVLARWSSDEAPTAEIMADIANSKVVVEGRKQTNASEASGSIAVLPLYGIITQRGNMVDDVSGPGSTSTQMFTAALRSALMDESISSILIDIDSPGGSVYGVGELADEIYQARGQKPIIAFADSLAASAAYWIGSAASEFYIKQGGEVGSIGVLAAHKDMSKALETKGEKVTLITAGKYKAEGSPYNPLSDEARAAMQARVDEYYTAFTKGVAKGRNVPIAQVRSGMGQGRVLGAAEAISEKMVDGVSSIGEILVKMKRYQRAMPASRLAAAQNKLKILG